MNSLLTIKNDWLEASVSPEVGGSIYSLRYKLNGQWIDIMRPTPPEALQTGDAGAFASFHMIPYSNRIANAQLRFEKRAYALEANTPEGHAIHGEVRNRPFRILKAGEHTVILAFESRDYADITWPFPFSTQLTFEVSGNTFTMTMEVKNEGRVPCPVGMGTHPYFNRNLTDADTQLLVTLPVKGVYPGTDPIPTGPYTDIPEPLDFSSEKELGTTLPIDHCYRTRSGPSVLKWPGTGITAMIEVEEVFSHLVFYAPPAHPEFFAVEPVTNCNNGFNMAADGIEDTGTLYLSPGASARGAMIIRVLQE